MVTEITNENFESFVNDNESVLIDFHASWCGPCKAMSPTIDKIAESHPELTVGKCDVEEYEDIASQFGVMNIPFVVYIKNGKLIAGKAGLQTFDQLEEMIKMDKIS